MRAEDEVWPLVDQTFVAVDRLGEPACGEPVRRRGRVNPELEAAAARRLFRKPDGGDRRHGEGDARNTAIVGLARWTLQEVRGDDLRVVARHRGQGRPDAGGVTGGIDPRVGNAAQMRIELQSSVLHRDLPGGQVEAAEIGTTPGSMNDEIAGDLQVRRSLARGTHLDRKSTRLNSSH